MRPLSIAFALALIALSRSAHAHVKWFGKWDIICPPRSMPDAGAGNRAFIGSGDESI